MNGAEQRSASAVRLVGLDVGTTTTSFLVASARMLRNCVTGRNEFGELRQVFRPEAVFTPFSGDALDALALETQLDRWLAATNLDSANVASGGVIVTGLAARSANAAAVKDVVRRRFPQALVAATDDPCLESWLAFMGNTLALSISQPESPFLNLDIGGGTTNVAWGVAGEVRRCGCYYVGARHIQVEPGTYRARALSSFATALLDELAVPHAVGYDLTPGHLGALLDFYVDLLESVVSGQSQPAGRGRPDDSVRCLHCQTAFVPPETRGKVPIITLSGGVGELAYRHARGEPLPETTAFGDLGIDLARRICQSRVLGRNLNSHVPAGLGRATVQGLTLHGSEISGSTLFLPDPRILPLNDLPILGTFGETTSDDELVALFDLARRASAGACLCVQLETLNAPSVKRLGGRLAPLLERLAGTSSGPLVLLTSGNVGKTLGQYATRWGRLSTKLVVIDEIPNRSAQFVTIGAPREGLVPVSFHGLAASLRAD